MLMNNADERRILYGGGAVVELVVQFQRYRILLLGPLFQARPEESCRLGFFLPVLVAHF